MSKKCLQCGKEIKDYLNYCDGDCLIQSAKDAGGRVHCPNGLPIRCIKHDNTMLEHEHGDHPDYKFPVTVVWGGNDRETETHALIYNDRTIAVTMYECCYYMWLLRDGTLLHGPSWIAGWEDKCRLNDESVAQIRGK